MAKNCMRGIIFKDRRLTCSRLCSRRSAFARARGRCPGRRCGTGSRQTLIIV